MRPLRFLAEADAELYQAAMRYESERIGLGDRFLSIVEIAVAKVRERPEAWTQISRLSRRYRLDKFPYALIYQIRPDEIVVISVMHLHRDSQYWREREI